MTKRKVGGWLALRAGAIAGIALALHASPAVAMTPGSAQRSIDGRWSGDGTTMTVDIARLQVNLDPDKPFDWRAFHLVDVKGDMVVFDVGAIRYFALFSGPNAMTVTSPNFTGQRAMRRAARH